MKSDRFGGRAYGDMTVRCYSMCAFRSGRLPHATVSTAVEEHEFDTMSYGH